MKTAVYLIFFVIVPILIIFFRLREKYKTGFAAGMVITSLLLGLIIAQSVEEKIENKFVRLMNENSHQEAELVFKSILQENPENISRITTSRLINPVKYERMKKRLKKYYTGVSESVYNKYRKGFKKTCNGLKTNRLLLEKLKHSRRIALMADVLGRDKNIEILINKIEAKIEVESNTLDGLSEKCGKNH